MKLSTICIYAATSLVAAQAVAGDGIDLQVTEAGPADRPEVSLSLPRNRRPDISLNRGPLVKPVPSADARKHDARRVAHGVKRRLTRRALSTRLGKPRIVVLLPVRPRSNGWQVPWPYGLSDLPGTIVYPKYPRGALPSYDWQTRRTRGKKLYRMPVRSQHWE